MKLIRLNIYCEILGHFESLEILNNLYARWKNCEIQVDLENPAKFTQQKFASENSAKISLFSPRLSNLATTGQNQQLLKVAEHSFRARFC